MRGEVELDAIEVEAVVENQTASEGDYKKDVTSTGNAAQESSTS